jgi:hypothetical protein
VSAVGAWALFAAVAAQASTITVGSVLPITFASKPFGQVKTIFNTTLPEKGANLVSPVDGAIVRWRTQGAIGGPFYLRVLHPNGKGAYTAAGTSGPATPVGSGLQTFAANLPIHSGDLIGVDPTGTTDEIGFAPAPGAAYAFVFPPPLDGSTVAPSGTESGEEIELSAEVQPIPAISSVAPSSGSIAGGETVTIKGENFTGASAVKFGTNPAASFTVDSDTQITATTPPNAKPVRVDVSVTSFAGTSVESREDRFNYTACVVPKLKGKKLKGVRTALRDARCKLGRVKGNRHGKVASQRPKAGRILAPGSKVNVRMRRSRR